MDELDRKMEEMGFMRCEAKDSNNETMPAEGTCTGKLPCSTGPCRRGFSREEIIEEAKVYMRETWGPCRESEDRDRWHERLGMLVDFIHDRFPSNNSSSLGAKAP